MSLNNIEIGDLNEPARILLQNAQTLDASGESAPTIPNAGQSTAFVGEAITSLAEAMSELVISSARAADVVQACDNDYAATEHTNATDVAEAGPQGGPR